LFLATYPTNTINSGLTIAIEKLYEVVLIIDLFDIKKVSLIVKYDSTFFENSSTIMPTNYSALEFQFGSNDNVQKFTVK